jgi:hypothetical protein
MEETETVIIRQSARSRRDGVWQQAVEAEVIAKAVQKCSRNFGHGDRLLFRPLRNLMFV